MSSLVFHNKHQSRPTYTTQEIHTSEYFQQFIQGNTVPLTKSYTHLHRRIRLRRPRWDGYHSRKKTHFDGNFRIIAQYI
jgi:hypothetical protein